MSNAKVNFRINKPSLKSKGIKSFIGIWGAKGGVGKTTVAVSLARFLSRNNSVGILDANIDCPSLHKVFGLEGKVFGSSEKKELYPMEKEGIKIISMGNITGDEAILWRGPMAASALKDLLNFSRFGNLDVLLADFPPGIGDVPMTLLEEGGLDGMVLVSGPDEISKYYAEKCKGLCEKFGIPVLAVIENKPEKDLTTDFEKLEKKIKLS
ncbi:MAG: P-loop NTPase [Candidatus Micrarchaeota archaeon]|nr:P-loop NTPase [Candidatus Micrarchaeota archaeon]